MFSTEDTIVAIATPSGRGGIGVVRLSGRESAGIARALLTHADLEPRRATFSRVRTAPDVDAIDHVVATYFPAPGSYTGEDVVELSAHGSPVVLRAIVAAAVERGARPAEPGEFTLRAFLNGRIDLTQAEAVADLIEAATPLQARAAFDQLDGTLSRAIAEIDAALFDLVARLEASVDFPDEGYHFVEPVAMAQAIDALRARTTALAVDARRGRLVREGLQVAIVGPPNAGKSSLFNALVGSARAIVTDVPGTTRDLVTEVVDLDGLRVTLVDTAGLREAADDIEAAGVARARRAADVSDLVLHVVDGTVADPGASLQIIDSKVVTVVNKADLLSADRRRLDGAVVVSAKTGEGLDELRRRTAQALDIDLLRERPAITNIRHLALVERADAALARASIAAHANGGGLPEEFVLADLQEARAALEEVTGRRAPEDVLAHIFSRFCIGK